MMCIYHYGITQNLFTALKVLNAPLIQNSFVIMYNVTEVTP